jgi:hypothetical protein
MTDLFLERSFDPGLSRDDVMSIARNNGWCFEIYKVDWNGSMLSSDGHSMICWFSGRDAESVRMALRKAEADTERLWPGTVHDVPEPLEPNVIVERSFDAPVTLDEIQAIEDGSAWCLETRNVKFVRTFFSTNRQRMICLYAAPDAESVRSAQHEAGMPVERVWSFSRIGIEDLTS